MTHQEQRIGAICGQANGEHWFWARATLAGVGLLGTGAGTVLVLRTLGLI